MRTRTAFRLSLASTLLLPFLAVAATGDSLGSSASSSSSDASSSSGIVPGVATITVTQASPNGTVGSWTLLGADGSEQKGQGASHTLTNIPAGRYTVFATPPSGATTAVRVYEGATQVAYQPYPQANFPVNGNTEVRVSINYQYTRVGTVSVTSDPLGVDFTVTGPNGIVLEGVTPESFENQPEGQYKVQYHAPSGCGDPPPKGDVLNSNTRISFSMTLSCKAADALRSRQEDQAGNGKFVIINWNGESVTLRDVPGGEWFAPFVASVTKVGIMAGYRDAEGNPSGLFGPGNPVTVAELAKIAHSIAGMTELSGVQSSNPLAQEGWFTGVMASAEGRGWRLYADGTVDPLRGATRGEVLVTLLQALDVPVEWQKGNVFSDVTVKTPYASVIETAARAGIVSGTDDGNGGKRFSPDAPINRAELAKILSAAQATFRVKASSSAR